MSYADMPGRAVFSLVVDALNAEIERVHQTERAMIAAGYPIPDTALRLGALGAASDIILFLQTIGIKTANKEGGPPSFIVEATNHARVALQRHSTPDPEEINHDEKE